MKYQYLFTFLFSLMLGSLSLASDKQKVLSLDSWQKIQISGQLDLEIRSDGDRQELMLEGPAKSLERVKVEVQNQQLNIHVQSGWLRKATGVKATLFSPPSAIQEIDLSGAVSVKSLWQELSTERLKLGLSGASSLSIPKLAVRDLSASLSGASTLQIEDLTARDFAFTSSGANKAQIGGLVGELEIQASGASELNLNALESQAVDLSLSGASQIKIGETQQLSGKASGATKITYLGRPKVTVTTSGASSISQASR